MKDMWTALEERSRSWRALDRQALADGIWADYVTVRFGGTGDAQALQFLHPYLNRADVGTRLRAIQVAATVFRGCGRRAIGDLDYLTRNTDPFLRDRAVHVVAATVAGSAEEPVFEALGPYLNHRNQFIERQAMTALSKALEGTGSARGLAEIQRVCQRAKGARGGNGWEDDQAVARLFAGKPAEAAYGWLCRPDEPPSWRGLDEAMGILIRDAGESWYERAYREFFAPRLKRQTDPWWHFDRRWPVSGLCAASPDKGMAALDRIVQLRSEGRVLPVLMQNGPLCFQSADPGTHRGALLEMVRTGDLHQQRIAAVCLGRLLDRSEDAAAIALLSERLSAPSQAMRAAAITGLGMIVRGSCDENLRSACLKLAEQKDTAEAAVVALGRLFEGSSRSDSFEDVRRLGKTYQNRPVHSRRRYLPLVACYQAAGLIYQGTGSMDPVDFLLEALTPSPVQWSMYRWTAGRALVLIEHSARKLDRALGQGWN